MKGIRYDELDNLIVFLYPKNTDFATKAGIYVNYKLRYGGTCIFVLFQLVFARMQ